MFNKKGAFKNFAKLTGKHLWWSLFFNYVAGLRPSKIKTLKQVFFCQFFKLFENTFFYRMLPDDCFWIGLVVKKFNYVSLIFFNLQLNHAPPECSLLFWCNEEHLLMRKMSGVNSGTAIICEWNHREFDFLQNLGCIESSPTGKQRHVFWKVWMYIGTTDDLIVNHDLFLRILIYMIIQSIPSLLATP